MSRHWEDLQTPGEEGSRFKPSNSSVTSTPQCPKARFIDEETEAPGEVAEQA